MSQRLRVKARIKKNRAGVKGVRIRKSAKKKR